MINSPGGLCRAKGAEDRNLGCLLEGVRCIRHESNVVRFMPDRSLLWCRVSGG